MMSLDGFTGPIVLDAAIGLQVYHKVENEEIHLVLETTDTTNRWIGFGFAEQGE
jgi:hypothetical protein